MRTTAALLILTALLTRCSINPTAGGSTDTGNGIIAGTVVDSLGNPAPDIQVSLVPQGYNPVEDPATLVKTGTTSASGRFIFSPVDSGAYNVQAYDTADGAQLLITGVMVNKDTADIQTAMLRAPGAVLLTLPDTVDTVTGYVYVPGTVIHERLADETLIYDNGLINIIVNPLPAGALPGIYYRETASSHPPMSLLDEPVIAQGDTTDASIIRSWSAYTTANSGIPQNNIVAIMVDASGMLWLGTQDSGLAAFNGSSWAVYNTKNSSLPHNTVKAVAEDMDGSIWIGTADGLVNIVNNTWRVYTTATDLMTEDHINDIGIDAQNGYPWMGTLTGASMYDGSKWHFQAMVGGVPVSDVHAAAAGGGAVFFGTNAGIFSCDYNDGNWKYIPVLGNASMNIMVWDIAIDKYNTRWLATSGGVISYDTRGLWGVYNSTTVGIPGSTMKSVAVYGDNSVWAGTHADGTIVKLGNSTGVYSGSNTAVLQGAGTINAVVAGNNNTLYFATEKNGLILLRFVVAREQVLFKRRQG